MHVVMHFLCIFFMHVCCVNSIKYEYDCTNHCIAIIDSPLLCGFKVAIKQLTEITQIDF